MSASPTGTGARADLLSRGIAELQLQADAALQVKLLAYLDLLIRWNRHYNLTAIRDADAMLSHHLMDCLSAVPHLETHARSFGHGALRILDVGSGAGLPGLVLAVMRPDWTVCCVDAVAKKAGFVRQAAAELHIPNLISEHGRVEDLHRPPFDVVTSRAFASLADFAVCTRGQLAQGGCWMAMKGKVPTDEISSLPPHVQVFHVEHLRVPGLSAQRCLVWMRPV